MSASDINVAAIASVIYSGSAFTPVPAVTDDGRNAQLTEGVDFDIAYENNTAAGTASVTITGKGNYTGSVSRTFDIGKAMPAIAFTSVNSRESATTIALNAGTSSPGTVSYALVSGTTNTFVSGSTLTLGQAGSATVRATVAATTNYESATVTQAVTITGVKPTLVTVTGTPGTTSADFDANTRAIVNLGATYSNPAGYVVNVYYTIRRVGSTGSFVYTNGSTATTARMAVQTINMRIGGAIPLTAYTPPGTIETLRRLCPWSG